MCAGTFEDTEWIRKPAPHDIHTFASAYGGTNTYCGIVVYGQIEGKYLALGNGNSSAWPGCPKGHEHDHERNARSQHFQLGSGTKTYLYHHPTTGTHEVHGGIAAAYHALGGTASSLGLPATDEKSSGGGGRYNTFFNLGTATCNSNPPSNGSIYWRSDLGAHEIHGSIRAKWCELGKEWSILGYPTSDELPASGLVTNPSGRESRFENGRIWWSSATGSHEVHGPVLTRYLADGGPSTYGFPLTDVYTVGTTQRADFETASIIHDDASGQTVVCPAPCLL